MLKYLKIWTLLALGILMIVATPVLAQDTSDQSGDGAQDTSMVFGDGQDGSGNTDYDYEALVKELYGSEDTTEIVTDEIPVEVEKARNRNEVRGPAPGMFANSRLNGAYLSFNMASPYAVAGQLESWYSYIDAGMAVKLPYEVYVESIPLYFLFEVSSFSFENTYPQGGTFAGLAYILQASAIGDQSSAALGFGFWDSEIGSMLELGYRFRPTKNTFFRVGTRGVLITDIELIGSAWWAELRLSMGFEL
ncbi:MAG: hypothetical protein HQ556_16040 [Candidatus Marinimicrobia bacterium]|nr:hypothetical protein [Candidatus Neomarinimicrobiota bacterium]